jgi:hypothetical protein
MTSFLLLFLPKDQRGIFGDMFGAVNALFSGLAFVGIVITLYLQNQETARQQFENTFFNLLTYYNDSVNSLIPVNSDDYGQGQLFLSNFVDKLYVVYKESTLADEKNKITSSVSMLMGSEYAVLTNWLDKVYRILYYIQRHCPENKPLYNALFHSRMSNYETALLFYLVLSFPTDDNTPSLRDLLIEAKFFQITNVHVFFDLSHADILRPIFEGEPERVAPNR